MNEGIFITKPGVALPAGTEMSSSNFAGYQADLVLPLIKDTNHTYDVFEGFKYRGFINEAVNAKFTFNNKTDYVPNFLSGSGSLNTANGLITSMTTPLQVEENNKIFLQGSNFKAEQLASGDDVALRIASIDGASRILFNIDTHALTFHKNNVSTASTTPSITEPDVLIIAVDEDNITVSTDAPAVLYTLARTHTSKVLSGAIGVLSSSGTVTGDALPFSDQETLEAADITGEGTMSVESSFGQLTTYTIRLGAALVTETEKVEVSVAAGQAASESVESSYTGGVGEKSYSLDSGQIPAGLELNEDGTISGTPTTDGIYEFSITVTDELGTAGSIDYKITVKPVANVSYNPPSGVEGQTYSFHPHISGLTDASLETGSIPTGLVLNASTGALSGTPTANGTYNFSLSLEVGTGTEPEIVPVTLVIYNPMQVEGISDNDSVGILFPNSETAAQQSKTFVADVTGGSGQFQYSITGGNFINSNGEATLLETGEITITVTDIVTGEVTTFKLLVAGQGDVGGFAIDDNEEEVSDSVPNTDILTDCNTPVKIAFNGMHLIKGVEVGESAYRAYPNVNAFEGMSIQQNGHPFVMIRSTADDGFAIADDARDGKPFILEFVANPSMISSTGDVAVGVAKKFDVNSAALNGLDFACVITTISGNRKVEIRKSNVYQAGSRFAIAEGQQVGFAVFSDSVLLYIDGLLKYTLTSNTFACSGLDIVFFAQKANVIYGGKVANLLYDIETAGTVDEVGSLDAVTGEYTPSLNNVGLVRVKATSTANADVIYHASIRIISGAAKNSLENALIEGTPVEMWIAELVRKDNLPLRLDREGRPDRNQLTNPGHLGTLQGSGKMEATPTRQDFRNDRGATSTGMTIDKVTITAVYLGVRDQAMVKRLVPYMKQANSQGVRQLKQYSTGCQKHMRVVLVWQTADCGDIPIFDAIEVVKGLSYTMFNIEVGQQVQSNIPITIEGFPDENGLLFDYNQYDKHFQRIGSGN